MVFNPISTPGLILVSSSVQRVESVKTKGKLSLAKNADSLKNVGPIFCIFFFISLLISSNYYIVFGVFFFSFGFFY